MKQDSQLETEFLECISRKVRVARNSCFRDTETACRLEAEMFLTLFIIGVIGLILMALPGLNHHSGIGAHPGLHLGTHTDLHLGSHTAGHGVAPPPVSVGGHAAGHLQSPAHPSQSMDASGSSAVAPSGFQLTSLIPSPRAIFSLLTLFGAFGITLSESLHLSILQASLWSVVPAIGIEYLAVRPLWNWMFSFQGKPTTSIETLVLHEAKAVTPFRNGKGVVAIKHDGRIVQFSASLPALQSAIPVKVGDRLQIDEVDSTKQRVKVSIKTELAENEQN